MTKVAIGFQDEDDGESAGERRTTDEILAELAVKQKRDKELLARLIEVAERVGVLPRRNIEGEEERGR